MAFLFTWNATFLSQPADSEAASLGASRIRDFKNATTERMQIDHSWLGDANDGKHLQVTYNAALGADPTTVAGTGYSYTKTVSGNVELFYKDGAGNVVQVTSVGKVLATSYLPLAGGTLTGGLLGTTGNFSGNVTAGSFTGNVTGNVTGSSGSCTGNAATVTTNANLTGDITSVGNATTLAAPTAGNINLGTQILQPFTGTGSTSTPAGLFEQDGGGGTNIAEAFNCKIVNTGTYRVAFSMAYTTGATQITGQVYKNGVAVGALHTRAVAGFQEFTDDLAFTAGDTVQIFLQTATGGACSLKNVAFRVASANGIHNPQPLLIGLRS